ncbi:hypothetical protein [Haliea sp. E17]|uniref:hypothetical protein n=1 Tax=Haliea sp. E17 TaxID=3401576 RepID=UPI003AB06627
MPLRIPDWCRLAACVLLLQACAQAPQAESPASAEPAATPDIQLNLDQGPDCNCSQLPSSTADYTFLEKGMAALAAGNIVEGRQYFQRYQRLEDTPVARWESAVAQAYIDALAVNPERNLARARTALQSLDKQDWRGLNPHPQVLLMRQALQNFLGDARRVDELQTENQALRADLAKREETIKRLRELTLGQKGVSP